MKLPQTGGCLCGKIRYEITEAPQLVYTCHCVDCQRLTSSAFSMAIVVTDVAFRIARIEPRAIQRTADSGAVVTRWVCPECGSWVCGASSSDDGLRPVRAGTLDDTSWLRPTAHFWTRSKQPWITLPEGDQIFETLLQNMTQNAALVTPGMQFVLATRHLERIADHSTNIAEDVLYYVKGIDVRHHAEAVVGGGNKEPRG